MAKREMLVVIAAPQDLGCGLAWMWEAFAIHETGYRTMRSRSKVDADI